MNRFIRLISAGFDWLDAGIIRQAVCHFHVPDSRMESGEFRKLLRQPDRVLCNVPNRVPVPAAKSLPEDPAVVVASIHYLRRHLQATGLSIYFDFTLSDEADRFRKPHQEL